MSEHKVIGVGLEVLGGKRFESEDGGYVVLGPRFERYYVHVSGDFHSVFRKTRAVKIEDMPRVERIQIQPFAYEIAYFVRFAGEGVFAYRNLRNGKGMTIDAQNVFCRILRNGTIAVSSQLSPVRAGSQESLVASMPAKCDILRND